MKACLSNLYLIFQLSLFSLKHILNNFFYILKIIILKYIRQNPIFLIYPKEDLMILERRIRENHFIPFTLMIVVKRLENIVRQNKAVSVGELIKTIDRIDFDL